MQISVKFFNYYIYHVDSTGMLTWLISVLLMLIIIASLSKLGIIYWITDREQIHNLLKKHYISELKC